MNTSRTRRLWLLTTLILLIASLASAASEPVQLAAKYTPRLEKILTTNIVPFWYDKSLDRTNGGYTISFDAQGKLKEPVTKMIVTQARQVWLFSRLARAGYEPKKYLEAAEHGYRFLREKMWDPTYGGFYWEVDVTGNQKLQPNKHLYGQSFATLCDLRVRAGQRQAGRSGFRHPVLQPAGREVARQAPRRLSRVLQSGLDARRRPDRTRTWGRRPI